METWIGLAVLVGGAGGSFLLMRRATSMQEGDESAEDDWHPADDFSAW